MIFATVGLHYHPFDRFVLAVDDLAGSLDELILIQTGFSKVRPRYCQAVSVLDERARAEALRRCRMVISHAGAGTVIDALSGNKPLIVMPRRRAFGEHNDDNQLEFAQALAEIGLARFVSSPVELKEAVSSIGNAPATSARTGVSPEKLTQKLCRWLKDLESTF